jgi:pyridoxal biosynthesis lyase PdxS
VKLLEASEELGVAMFGLDVANMPESERLAVRGW